jgi:hypothetical protein
MAMSKTTGLLLVLMLCSGLKPRTEQYITKQGKTSFFSYTTVEDIKADNNQVLSIFDLSKNEIAVSMLMRTFVFEKALMQEHFNESYIESDIYPKATFEGAIQDFDSSIEGVQIKLIKGPLTIHGITKNVEIKTTIENTSANYVFYGEFDVSIKDFDIKVPALLAPNIAKTISISFRFEYLPYEK